MGYFILSLDYIIIAMGFLLIILGTVGWKKKIKGMFCGPRKIEVNTKKYVKFMGILYISVGLSYIATAIVKLFSEVNELYAIVMFPLILHAILSKYCENKYRLHD